MSLHDRAAQFAPFAALIGYDEMVGEEARMTDRQITPGESELEELNLKFRILSERLDAKQRPEISVLIFVPDPRKAGGRYETLRGHVRRLNEADRTLILTDGTKIEIDSVVDLTL